MTGRWREARSVLPAVALVVLLGAPGCGTPQRADDVGDPGPATTADPGLPERDPRPRPDRARQQPPVSPADRALAEAFAAFAARPGPTTAAPLRLAPVVWLGLGENLFTAVPGRTLGDPDAWALDVDAFGRLGPLDALGPVRRHLRTEGLDAIQVSVGRHPRCAGPRTPAPARFRASRQVVLRPDTSTVDSCLDWWAVDLFVGADGLLRGVTLQLWEP